MLTLLASSCKDDDDLNVTLKSQGNLSFKFVDSNANPVANVAVTLYLENNTYDTQKTNEEGVANFGELLSGFYSITTKAISIGNSKYSVRKTIQVTPGMSSALVINPQEYVGEITLIATLNIDGSRVVASNVGVALIPQSDVPNVFSDAEILALAYVKGTTNESGKVTLKNVPANIPYAVFIYANKLRAFEQGNLSVGKDNAITVFYNATPYR